MKTAGTIMLVDFEGFLRQKNCGGQTGMIVIERNKIKASKHFFKINLCALNLTVSKKHKQKLMEINKNKNF